MLRRLATLLLLALPAAAQQPPACNPARAGAVACLAGRLCECRFERGGSITGTRDGHRWDCNLLRPGCGEALAPPGIRGQAAPMPDILLQPVLPPDRLPRYP
jgi:hypothetical protein